MLLTLLNDDTNLYRHYIRSEFEYENIQTSLYLTTGFYIAL